MRTRPTQYRVEFLDPEDEGHPNLVHVFYIRDEARLELEREWKRWQALAEQSSFRHRISKIVADHFTVRTPTDRVIVYRVATVD